MRRLLIPLTLSSLSLLGTGCGQDLCNRIQSSHDSLVKKAAPCAGVDVGLFNVTTCKQGESACSSQDSSNINATWDCIDKLPTCSPGSEATWVGQLGSCQSQTAVTTQACATAVQPTPSQ